MNSPQLTYLESVLFEDFSNRNSNQKKNIGRDRNIYHGDSDGIKNEEINKKTSVDIVDQSMGRLKFEAEITNYDSETIFIDRSVVDEVSDDEIMSKKETKRKFIDSSVCWLDYRRGNNKNYIENEIYDDDDNNIINRLVKERDMIFSDGMNENNESSIHNKISQSGGNNINKNDRKNTENNPGNIDSGDFIQKNNLDGEKDKVEFSGIKKHQKVFFFIVDALRLDFMVENKSKNNGTSKYEYDNKSKHENVNGNENRNRNKNGAENENERERDRDSKLFNPSDSYNKMKNMHQLLRKNASQTAFYGFRADPPTVTSQRLKGKKTHFFFLKIIIKKKFK